MRQRRSVTGILLGLASALLFCAGQAIAQGVTHGLPPEVVQFPDSIYMNGHIVTLDDHEMNANPGTIAEAMAIRDEVILAVGSNKDIMKLAGPKTRIIDLKGKTVLPGIVESHVHPMSESEAFAREKYHLRTTPEGYALSMDVGATPDETMAKVADAMELLLANANPNPDEWINISLVHNPELGFATPADVSTLMSTPKLSDVKISRSDITEIIPNYPFVLSSATSILDAPEKNVWYHITVGEDGEPINTKVVDLK